MKSPAVSGAFHIPVGMGVRTLAAHRAAGFDTFVGSEFGRTKCARRAKTWDRFRQSLTLRICPNSDRQRPLRQNKAAKGRLFCRFGRQIRVASRRHYLRIWRHVMPPTIGRQRNFAAVMNWLNDSHQTTTVLKSCGSNPGGKDTMKFSKVLTLPTSTMDGLRRRNSASVSTHSSEK